MNFNIVKMPFSRNLSFLKWNDTYSFWFINFSLQRLVLYLWWDIGFCCWNFTSFLQLRYHSVFHVSKNMIARWDKRIHHRDTAMLYNLFFSTIIMLYLQSFDSMCEYNSFQRQLFSISCFNSYYLALVLFAFWCSGVDELEFWLLEELNELLFAFLRSEARCCRRCAPYTSLSMTWSQNLQLWKL